MENPTPTTPEIETTPPRLLPSFIIGFNTVANHIWLILLPVLIDLALWFGPHLRMKQVLLPMALDAIRTVREGSTPQAAQMLTGMEEIWKVFLERYNLAGATSTFPLGIPSLMAGQSPLRTPLGAAPLFEVSSGLLVPLLWLLFSLVGILLGSLYFSMLANCFQKKQPVYHLSPRTLLWQSLQMIFLVILLTILLVVVLLPAIVISSVLVLLSPLLSWVVLLAMSFLSVWLMVPFLFTPHGIFAMQQDVMKAALTSTRVVRRILPGIGMFLLLAIVLYQGLGVLWRIPAETSWMALVGILGHAFTSTAVLASSFAYYLSCLQWVQAMSRRATALQST